MNFSSLIKNKSIQIGFIGLGSIGLPIASHILQAGFKLKLHTKNRFKQLDGALKNEAILDSPLATAENTQILMICVNDDKTVEEVLFGELGAARNLRKGSIVIDLSTISPNSAIEIGHRLSQQGVDFLDSPVTGGTEGAQKGELTLLVGGESSALELVLPILKIISKNINYFGSIGNGQKVKAINQVIVAGTFASIAEGIALGMELALPMDQLISSLQKGAAGSWALDHRAYSMLGNNYPLGFKIELHHKDLDIALRLARSVGLTLPLTKIVKDMESDLISDGMHDKDISALRKWVSSTKKATASDQ